MIINGKQLVDAKPIVQMVDHKILHLGVSYGLGEAGYDIRIKQEVRFGFNERNGNRWVQCGDFEKLEYTTGGGRFALASAIEQFQMPNNLTGIVHDKSTWARRGLSVFNTVIEPGWHGFLTLELVYHGQDELIIPAGAGIAQVMFHEVVEPAAYKGKYQYQGDRPVEAIKSE